MFARKILIFSSLWWAIHSFGQASSEVFVPLKPKPTYHTAKITKPPKIDGNPNDECWKHLEIANDFIAFQPTPNTRSAVRTEVRLGYDNEALYLCAYMYDNPKLILRELGQRDDINVTADFFNFGIDAYNDDQSAQRYGITAAGVQADSRISAGSQESDFAWDVVWESAVSLHADGWVAEYRIPYSALRFPNKKVQNWGIQFTRVTRRLGEQAVWATINPRESGFVQFYGELEGLENIQPPLRLSLSPYVAASVSRDPADGGGYNTSKSINGGLDMKLGLNESFTLDMTLIPNFGQVQSDNKLLNLSPFEVQFTERRPFFIEGTELFNIGDLFYSRRLGGTPTRYYEVSEQLRVNEVVKSNPAETQLLNATKISGRTNKNWGLGFLNAVAAPTFAEIQNEWTGEKRTFQTSVLTNYNIFTIQKVLPNNSDVSFTNANTWRAGDERDANVSALRFKLRDKKNRYEIAAMHRLSQIYEPQQQGTYGHNFNLGMGKVSGNFNWNYNLDVADNQWDPSDLNIFYGNNVISNGLNFSYNTYEPKGKFLQTNTWLGVNYRHLYKPSTPGGIRFNQGFWGLLRNQGWVNYFIFGSPVQAYDFFEARVPGRNFYRQPFIFSGLNYGTDPRKKLFANFNFNYGNFLNGERGAFWGLGMNPTWRVSNRFNLSWDGRWEKDFKNYGFLTKSDDNTDITFGARTVETVIQTFSMAYKFDAYTNLTFRARHYWGHLEYLNFYQLQADGTLQLREWQRAEDRNFNIFNIDMIFNRQFAPGSFLTVIWKNNIFTNKTSAEEKLHGYGYNFLRTMESPQSNSLTIKVIYFLDYLDFKKMIRKQ